MTVLGFEWCENALRVCDSGAERCESQVLPAQVAQLLRTILIQFKVRKRSKHQRHHGVSNLEVPIAGSVAARGYAQLWPRPQSDCLNKKVGRLVSMPRRCNPD